MRAFGLVRSVMTSEAPASNRAPLVLRFRGREMHFRSGQCIVGRDPTCSVCIDDPLVSRRHARITTVRGSVLISDLSSANGVYVNGRRVVESCPVPAGAKILIGKEELVLLRSETRSDRPSETGAHEHIHETIRRVISEPPRARSDIEPVLARASDETSRIDTFELLSKVVDRILDEGRAADAERILAPQLEVLLNEAKRRGELPADVVSRTADYSVKLAVATGASRWMDFVVNLYTAVSMPMPVRVAQSLAAAARSGGDYDRTALRRYVSQMLTSAERLSAAEREALGTLQKLARGLPSSS